MNTEKHKLPFDPPVGATIEKTERIGPFILHVDYRLPDGTLQTWRSRSNRTNGGLRTVRSPADATAARESRWWLEVWALAKVAWWTALLFIIGSACFMAASAAPLQPGLFGEFAANTTAINRVFFVGSIFFTLAAFTQFLAAVNANRVTAIAHGHEPTTPFRWFAWRPGQIGWLSAFTQFVGTLLFNVNTFDALLPGLDWLRADLLIWTPDIIGSVCFLIASGLAYTEYSHGSLVWKPRDVSWRIVCINLLGSVAFGIAAVYAIILPGDSDILSAWNVNFFTFAGGLCFLVGAYLLIPEAARNVREIVRKKGISVGKR